MNRSAGLILLCLLHGPGLAASEPLTPEKALDRYGLSDIQLSPDGRRVAFVVSEPVEGVDQNRDLWLYDADGGELVRLTTSAKPDRSPRWSPDGKTLAFISARTDPPQIHFLSLGGGEARAVTRGKTEVSELAWSPLGGSIAFLAPEPKSEEEQQRDKDKDDARVVDADDRPAQLWLLDVASGEVKPLTSGRWRIASFTWAPNGERLLVAATDQPEPELETMHLYSLSVSAPEMRLVAAPGGPLGHLRVGPDGRYVAYLGSPGDGPVLHDLFVLPLDGGRARNLTRASLDRPVIGYRWLADGTILAQVAESWTTHFYTVGLDGRASRGRDFGATHALGAFDAAEGLVAFVGESPVDLPELFIAEDGKDPVEVSDFHASWDDVDLVTPERVTYPSFDGTSIEALLLKPARYVEGERVALIVLVHGGPTGRWSARFNAWGQLLAARGFAVLLPNIRGSTGYGHEFLAANRRDWGGGDYRDVLAGVDYLIEEGVADPERLGIGGWSYGGYMATWAVTQTGRFRAAVSGAPMTDLASEYGTEMSRINAYDTWFLGNPYENQKLFVARSPITHVRNAETPTLILCGENDRTDPIGQCTEFYRGLKRYGVETELVLYPREDHGFREEKHQLDVLERVVEWFERYLDASSRLATR